MAGNDDVRTFLEDHRDVTHLDAVLIDLCGQPYGKRLPRAHIEKFYRSGTPVCAAMSLVDVRGNTADPLGYGFSDGDPDATVRPLPGRLVCVPWAPGLAQVLCVPEDAATGKPVWFDPRTVLDGVTSRFADAGLTPVVALELEFYLIDAARGDDGAPLPAASPRHRRPETAGKVLSLDKLDEFAPVLSAILDAARAQNLPVSTMISEYGPGQFEINLEHRPDPLGACDDAVLLRRSVASVARAQGLDATFMSVPFAGEPGSGLHVHISLQDDKGNIFARDRADADAKLSAALAGLRAIHAEAMAIFAPNINVYRRFVADNFTPVTTDWGENNRSVAYRIPSGPAASRRVEHRAAGAEANPYLVTAAVLAGILHGLENQLDAGPAATGNAGSETDPALPLTWWAALDALKDAKLLPGLVGEDYCRIYHAVKQAELEAFMQTASPQEYDWYL